MDYPREQYPINIRFVTQGMLKVSKEDVPEGLKEWPKEKVWQWALDYFEQLSKQAMVAAVAYLEPQEDSMPGCVEVNDDPEDFPILAQSEEWDAFMGAKATLK